LALVLPFLAGLLTTLSPCVLPILPFVTASSLKQSKLGPIFLAAGLLITFVSASLLIGASGALLGLEPIVVRRLAGVLMMASGALFLSQRLADGFASKLAAISNRASDTNVSLQGRPALSEFLNGMLLGVIWTPCSGPSLGAALGLAANEATRAESAIALGAFGLGSVLPLMIFAYGAQGLALKFRDHRNAIGNLKKIFGVLIVILGFLILSGFDHSVEAALTELLPDAWVGFITRF
jgi:cytochrome c-type biogenesis protein